MQWLVWYGGMVWYHHHTTTIRPSHVMSAAAEVGWSHISFSLQLAENGRIRSRCRSRSKRSTSMAAPITTSSAPKATYLLESLNCQALISPYLQQLPGRPEPYYFPSPHLTLKPTEYPMSPRTSLARQLCGLTLSEWMGWGIFLSAMTYTAACESRRLGQTKDSVTFCEGASNNRVIRMPPHAQLHFQRRWRGN